MTDIFGPHYSCRAMLLTKMLSHNPKRADGRLEMLLMELGQFWMIFTIGVSWLCLIPAKSVQTLYIALLVFIAVPAWLERGEGC